MIILGIILIIAGFLLSIPVLWWIGVLLVIIGLVLTVMGRTGHPFMGRSHYW